MANLVSKNPRLVNFTLTLVVEDRFTGAPLPNANVKYTIGSLDPPGGERISGEGRTDEKGQFVIEGTLRARAIWIEGSITREEYSPSKFYVELSASERRKTQAIKLTSIEPSLEEAKMHIEMKKEPATQTVWYFPQDRGWLPSSEAQFKIYPYIGTRDGYKWLRLKACVKNWDWVFVEELLVLIDGRMWVIPLNRYEDITTDVSSGFIYEIVDVGGQDKLIRAVANAREVYFTFQGRKRRVSYKLTDMDVRYFKYVVLFYDALPYKEHHW